MERPLSSSDRPSSPDGPPHAALHHTAGATIVVCIVACVGLAISGHLDTVAKDVYVRFSRLEPIATDPDTATATLSGDQFSLRDLANHPDAVHRDYLTPTVFAGPLEGVETRQDEIRRDFQALLDLFSKRQGVDDNFTIRVTNGETHELLEVFALTDARERYRRGAEVDWRAIDRERRRQTRRLVDKYEDRGVPREDITVKWGRANQIDLAHERDRPYLAYEIRLTNYLDLSLLPTEIGTVETFNRDDLVSPVGARSRYQMMPFILRRSGIHRYSLRNAEGSWVQVREDWNPLLTMEPAFRLLRGYINAVGHEIPGISAYHTGPGNIYKLYRLFFTESQAFDARSTVMDAYMWAVTDGFETVREQSSFGPYSRGYVASAYGALRAIDTKPIDPSNTVRADRVQLRAGRSLMLDDVLAVLDTTRAPIDWGVAEGRSTYERFRILNEHVDLPETRDGELTPRANVRFVSAVDGKAVRFFLPIGGADALRQAGITAIDTDATFRFDESTYRGPEPEQLTVWDRRYANLVDDVKDFGFTEPNRDRLLKIYDAFERLAKENPSHYRDVQLDIIQTHRRIWMSEVWNDLSKAAVLATGKMRMRPQPPEVLETGSVDDHSKRVEPEK